MQEKNQVHKPVDKHYRRGLKTIPKAIPDLRADFYAARDHYLAVF
jgi:hypothetical protein